MIEKNSAPASSELTVQHIIIDELNAADELAATAGIQTTQVYDALAKGGVWLSAAAGKSGRFNKPVRIRGFNGVVRRGDKVHLNYNAQVLQAESEKPVLVSDQVNYSFWYKPAGVFSQGTRWGDHCSMPFLVAAEYDKPAYLVHRLDRAASGLMILAHTKNALKRLTAMFAERGIDKTYRATVHGVMDRAVPFDLNAPVDGKRARTRVLTADNCTDQTSILTVKIETGRKHQIRSHLSSAGFPIVGDRLFDPQRKHQQNLQLVAIKLALQCPFTGRKVSVSLPESLTTDSKADSRAVENPQTPPTDG